MRRSLVAWLLLCYGPFGAVSLAYAADLDVSLVFVKNREIFAAKAGEDPRQLTHDGAVKWLPLWSKDGGRIAFLRAVSQGQALANLIVLDPNGEQTAEIAIRPADSAPPAGMRFVEDVEWLSSERIAVSGSINPSTAENLVFDLPSSREVRDFYDDGSRAVYSPDGAHVAYEVGSPHFTPAEEREPALEVDGKRVFPEHGVQLTFIAEPRWSPDSRKLAVVTDTMGAQAKSLAIWEAEDGQVRTFALELVKVAKPEVFWIEGDLFIRAGDQAWRLPSGSNELRRIEPGKAVDPQKQAEIRKAELEALVHKIGGRYYDFWCSDCVLAQLPRRASVNR